MSKRVNWNLETRELTVDGRKLGSLEYEIDWLRYVARDLNGKSLEMAQDCREVLNKLEKRAQDLLAKAEK